MKNSTNINTSETKTEMKIPQRGQIYFIKQPDQSTPVGSEIWGNRYGVIVSNDISNKYSSTVEIVYLSTRVDKKRLPTQVIVRCAGKDAIAYCEQPTAVDKSRLMNYIDYVNDSSMKQIEQALALQLGITKQSNPIHLYEKWQSSIVKYSLNDSFHANEDSVKDEAIRKLKDECELYKTLLNNKVQQLTNIKRMVSCIT